MKKTAIISVVAFVVGVIVSGWLVAGFKDKKKDDAVSAAVKVETDRAGKIEADLADARLRATVLAFHLRLGKLAIDSSRMNYGTAKDEAVEFFSDLQEFVDAGGAGKHEEMIRVILGNRDQIVSDLAVGSPTATEALQRLYLDLTKAAH